MDVSKFQLQGEWLELEIDSKKEKKLRVMILPLSTNEQIDIQELARKGPKEFIDKIQDLVIDWDLKDGDKDLECNDETKKKYLPFLINMKIKPEAEPDQNEEKAEKKVVGSAILKFAQNFDNFIKN